MPTYGVPTRPIVPGEPGERRRPAAATAAAQVQLVDQPVVDVEDPGDEEEPGGEQRVGEEHQLRAGER